MQIQRANRIQRSRRKGFRTPEGAIYVGRPTMWGNPFMTRRWGHAKSVILHRRRALATRPSCAACAARSGGLTWPAR